MLEENHEQDIQTLENWQVDKYIERVKENEATIKKYKDTLEQRILDLKQQFKQKEESLLKENQYLLTTLGEYAKLQEDLKSTKTQYKWESLSGNIIVKKVLPKPTKPTEKKMKDIEKSYPDLVTKETIKKLNWADLKKKIIIQDGVPYDQETGESLNEMVDIEYSEEEIQIK